MLGPHHCLTRPDAHSCGLLIQPSRGWLVSGGPLPLPAHGRRLIHAITVYCTSDSAIPSRLVDSHFVIAASEICRWVGDGRARTHDTPAASLPFRHSRRRRRKRFGSLESSVQGWQGIGAGTPQGVKAM